MPWRRALYLATTMQHTAIFPLTRLAEREAKFRWLAPLYEENYIFMAQLGSGFDVQQPQDMTGKRISLLRGDEKNFRLGPPVRSTSAWLAGSLDIGEAEAARYRTAMAELVADGTQEKIFRQYGLA